MQNRLKRSIANRGCLDVSLPPQMSAHLTLSGIVTVFMRVIYFVAERQR